MGGNALKTVKTKRLLKKDYQYKENYIVELLNKYFNNADFRIVKYFKNKEDFGDIDIIYYLEDQNFKKNLLDIIQKEYPEHEIPYISNGNVLSFGLPVSREEYFQIDMIKTNKEEIDFTEFYFSYNDLGNLMGRISKHLGLKLGHNGLFYVLRPENNPDHVFDEILVTKDIDLTMDILGFDKERYHNYEINDITDVYNFVINSDFFVKEIYLSEKQNHITKKREKKRKTYKGFINYIDSLNINSKYSIEDKEYLRSLIISKIFKIKDFNERYNESKRRMEQKKKFQSKFNGDLVSNITGLEGVKLGYFIKKFKDETEKSFDFKDYILSSDESEIEKRIIEFNKKLNNID